MSQPTATSTPTVAPALVGGAPALAPTLNTAPESGAVSLAGNSSAPSTPPVTASTTNTSRQQAPADSDDDQSRDAYPAGNQESTLGLSDNLLLGALVAVFALAVIALVTAGGRRGTWRQH